MPPTISTDQEDTMTPASMPLDDLLCQMGDTDSDWLMRISANPISQTG